MQNKTLGAEGSNQASSIEDKALNSEDKVLSAEEFRSLYQGEAYEGEVISGCED